MQILQEQISVLAVVEYEKKSYAKCPIYFIPVPNPVKMPSDLKDQVIRKDQCA